MMYIVYGRLWETRWLIAAYSKLEDANLHIENLVKHFKDEYPYANIYDITTLDWRGESDYRYIDYYIDKVEFFNDFKELDARVRIKNILD